MSYEKFLKEQQKYLPKLRKPINLIGKILYFEPFNEYDASFMAQISGVEIRDGQLFFDLTKRKYKGQELHYIRVGSEFVLHYGSNATMQLEGDIKITD